MTTAEAAYIHALLEPDTITNGNYKRHAPIDNVMSCVNDWNAYRNAFIAKRGQQVWDELNKPVKVNIDNL